MGIPKSVQKFITFLIKARNIKHYTVHKPLLEYSRLCNMFYLISSSGSFGAVILGANVILTDVLL